jgi:hypothetical protein
MKELEVPNLDCLNNEDLSDLAEVFLKLFSYSRYKAASMDCRLEGEIAEAVKYENVCDSLYKDLPEWARW